MQAPSWKWLFLGVVVIVVVIGGLVYAFGRPPEGPQVIAAPVASQTAWDTENWPAIMRGYEISTQTYELLPENVPVDRLHCSSCHLNGGGNPQSAWWVGLRARYATDAELQARINQCFERSMNGKPLCTPATADGNGDCDANFDMTSFLTYMNWLDEQWASQGLDVTPPQGFPPVAQLTGDPARGQQWFGAKCSMCHGVSGQGQTAQGAYAFPPLWGVHSFNASAGLATNQQVLAQFLRWNMPMNVPGTLTDQQAWDLAAYLESQPRPTEAAVQ